MRNLIIDHFGFLGVHGKDLSQRGFFEGMEVRGVETDDRPQDSLPDASLITVPISQAKCVVESIMRRRGENHPIIDGSGIMRSTNVGIHLPFKHISNYHLLAGANTKGIVNMAIIRGRIRNPVFEKFLVNAEANDTRIVETTVEEHDTTMAVIQGLVHSLSLILSEEHILPPEMAERRNKTPAQTGAEMILLNPRANPVAREFLAPEREKFSVLFRRYAGRLKDYLRGNDHVIEDFNTPYFKLFYANAEAGVFDSLDWNILSEGLTSAYQYNVNNLRDRIQESKEIS